MTTVLADRLGSEMFVLMGGVAALVIGMGGVTTATAIGFSAALAFVILIGAKLISLMPTARPGGARQGARGRNRRAA